MKEASYYTEVVPRTKAIARSVPGSLMSKRDNQFVASATCARGTLTRRNVWQKFLSWITPIPLRKRERDTGDRSKAASQPECSHRAIR